jgi:deoxyadenosine/deoxycytidine kinase
MTTLPKIIAIEGNIGAGKTTIFDHLKKRLSTRNDVVFMPEPVDIWQSVVDSDGETILAKFYRDPIKYAFSFQVMAYSTRLAMLRKTMCENPDCSVIICERSLEADRNIFAKMLRVSGKMESVEHQIYELLYKETAFEFPLHGAVYIDSEPEKCIERIGLRARTGESTIPLEYLQECRSYYDAWLLLGEPQFPVLRLDTNPDVTYNVEDVTDLGNTWIEQIYSFITSIEITAHKPNKTHTYKQTINKDMYTTICIQSHK